MYFRVKGARSRYNKARQGLAIDDARGQRLLKPQNSLLRDRGISERKVSEVFDFFEMFETFVGHARLGEIEPLETGQRFQPSQARIGDLRSAQIEPQQVFETLQMGQP